MFCLEVQSVKSIFSQINYLYFISNSNVYE